MRTLREEVIKWGALIASRPAYTLQAIKRAIGKGLDLASHKEAFANEYQVNTDMITPHGAENMVLRKEIQARYDAGGDSWGRLGDRARGHRLGRLASPRSRASEQAPLRA